VVVRLIKVDSACGAELVRSAGMLCRKPSEPFGELNRSRICE
jgi:hypothetical protein